MSVAITEQSGIIGAPSLSEEQVARAILARPHGAYTEYDIAHVIVPTYYTYCLGVTIDPVIAIAQAIHETGNFSSWWAGRPRRNPAGIGVTGRWQAALPADRVSWAWKAETRRWLHGVSFDSWVEDAIPAHVGRLLAWFLAPSQRSVIQNQLVARALSYRPLDLKHHGSAQTLLQLGKAHNPSGGGWASPGASYGRNVAAAARWLAKS